MAADPRPAPPIPPTLGRDARGWWVEGRCPDGVVRRIVAIRTRGDATMLLLRLGGILALGESDPPRFRVGDQARERRALVEVVGVGRDAAILVDERLRPAVRRAVDADGPQLRVEAEPLDLLGIGDS